MNSDSFGVLIVNDEPSIRCCLANGIASEVEYIKTASNSKEAFSKLFESGFPLVMVDVDFRDGMSGIELLHHLRQSRPQTAVMVIMAQGSAELAVQAMSGGAFDFVTKPLDMNLVRQQVRRAREHFELRAENQRLRQRIAESGQRTPDSMSKPAAASLLPNSLAEAIEGCERATIRMALESCGLHREKTAKSLGISIRTLHYKMGRYGLR